MLKQYGPAVPDEILRRLVLTFSELRDLADQGMINYPYSTREVVNMVKHLQVSDQRWWAWLNTYRWVTRDGEHGQTLTGEWPEVVSMVKH